MFPVQGWQVGERLKIEIPGHLHCTAHDGTCSHVLQITTTVTLPDSTKITQRPVAGEKKPGDVTWHTPEYGWNLRGIQGWIRQTWLGRLDV